MKRELSGSIRSRRSNLRADQSRGGTPQKRSKVSAATKAAGGRKGAQEGTKAMVTSNPDTLVGILRDTIVALVRRDGPDLSARQMGVFLTVYLGDGPHTVRGLAAELSVSKPAITRALDRLGELDLARRKVDPMDRRSVLVQRTLKGAAFLRDTRGIMEQAVREIAPEAEGARKAG
jgi:DNA-binding MarR family transcriptional regulator